LAVIAGLAVWALLPGGNGGSSTDLTDCPTDKTEDWTRIYEGEEAPTPVTGDEGTFEFVVTEVWYRDTSGGEIVVHTILTNVSGEPNYDHDENRYHALVVDNIERDEMWCFTSDPESVDPERSSKGHVGFRNTGEPSPVMELDVALGSGAEATIEFELTATP
jgi:hypothetical protein